MAWSLSETRDKKLAGLEENKMLTKDREQKVIELCQSLIQARSYSGEEKQVAELLKAFFESNEYDDVKIDQYGNIIGMIKGKRPGKKVLFDGHIDTVPVQDETKWTHKPFAAEICDGKIYGRGTSDMKGAVAAMANAAANFAKDCNKDFAGEIYVIAMNASRGGLLCIAIATIIALIYLSRRRLINRSQVILFILLLGFILYRFSGSLFLQIEYKMHYQGFEDLSRLSIYEAAWKVFIDYCTLGCGIALESAGAPIAATHNMYLEFLAQYGFIPFIAFLYFCYMPAFHLLKQRSIYNKYLGSAYILFSFPLFIIDSNYLADPAFWIFLASIASFNIMTKRSLRDKHNKPVLCN